MTEDGLVAGKSPSADELDERIDNLSDQHEHGSSEGKPDPLTAQSAPSEAGTQMHDENPMSAEEGLLPGSAQEERQS